MGLCCETLKDLLEVSPSETRVVHGRITNIQFQCHFVQEPDELGFLFQMVGCPKFHAQIVFRDSNIKF